MGIINLKISKLFIWLVIINIIVVGTAVFFYNGDYSFWAYPFSYAGTIKTFDGFPNTAGSYIYSLSMGLSGIIMLILTYHFYLLKNQQKNLFKTLLSFLGACGFIIAAFSPDDIRHTFHVIGSALFFAALWILASSFLFELKDNLNRRSYIFLEMCLQIPVFAYAITYFLALGIVPCILQKFALLGLGFILIYSAILIDESDISRQNR